MNLFLKLICKSCDPYCFFSIFKQILKTKTKKLSDVAKNEINNEEISAIMASLKSSCAPDSPIQAS